MQVSHGLLNFWLESNWPVTDRAAHHAIAMTSAYPAAPLVLGNVPSHTGRHSEALDEIRRARELDPLDPMLHAISSQFAYNARDFTSAARHARNAISADQEFWLGHGQLAQALGQMGDIEPALESLVKAERLSGGNSKALSTRGYILGKAGRTSEARIALEAMTRARERYVPICWSPSPGRRPRRDVRALDGVRGARRPPRLPAGRAGLGPLSDGSAVHVAPRAVRVHAPARVLTKRRRPVPVHGRRVANERQR